MVKAIPLSRGFISLVDDEDYAALSSHKWRFVAPGYAVRQFREKITQRQIYVSIHRHLLGLQEGDDRWVDHADGDGLNNQRGNLRIASPSQNNMNARRKCSMSASGSGYRGVKKDGSKWMARIGINREMRYLGSFATEAEAAAAYNEAAITLHKEFALLNRIKP